MAWCPDWHISLHKPPRKPPTCCWITTLFISPYYFSSSPRLAVYRLMAHCHLTIYFPHLTAHLLPHHRSACLTSRLPPFAVPCLTFSSNIPLFRHLRRISCSSLYITPVAFNESPSYLCLLYRSVSISLWRSWGHLLVIHGAHACCTTYWREKRGLAYWSWLSITCFPATGKFFCTTREFCAIKQVTKGSQRALKLYWSTHVESLLLQFIT